MRVRLSRNADANVSEILQYISKRNPRAAANLSRQFEAAVKMIGELPETGARTSRPGFRRIVCGKYLMVYEIKQGEAVIHYVRHGARQRPWEGEG